MSKKDDIDDLLGEGTEAKPAKKTASKKEAAPKADAKPAKKAAVKPAKKAAVKEEAVAEAKSVKAPAKKVSAKEDGEAKTPAKKEPISFEEGERQTISDGVTAHFKRSKKPINSRELAEKLGTETRKLRLVLYSLAKKEVITLQPGESKVNGMTVSPA